MRAPLSSTKFKNHLETLLLTYTCYHIKEKVEATPSSGLIGSHYPQGWPETLVSAK